MPTDCTRVLFKWTGLRLMDQRGLGKQFLDEMLSGGREIGPEIEGS